MNKTKERIDLGGRLVAADVAPIAMPGNSPLFGHAGLKTCRDC